MSCIYSGQKVRWIDGLIYAVVYIYMYACLIIRSFVSLLVL